jgi:hypothetical protein
LKFTTKIKTGDRSSELEKANLVTDKYNLNLPKETLRYVLEHSPIVANIMNDLRKSVPKLFRISSSSTIQSTVIDYLIGTKPLSVTSDMGERFNEVLKRNLKVPAKITTEQEKIANNLRKNISNIINGNKVSNQFQKDLGCTPQMFLMHLQLQFDEKMTWGNYGKWHVDHINPLCSFDLTDPEQVKEATNFNNLRPLWAIENTQKSKEDRKKSIRNKKGFTYA